MSNSDAAYRCLKCGATSALLMPEPVTQDETDVAVKCLECAHVQRVSRSLLEGAGGRLDSNSSAD
jgi:DNA-directed RNA polymerase subunit RPC12/RpoP